MKYLIPLVILLLTFCTKVQQSAISGINYPGQDVPKQIPQVFAPGLVSVQGRFELGFTISPDGQSMAFGVAHESNSAKTCIYLMHFTDGTWGPPDNTALPGNTNTFFPMFGPTGSEFYFAKSSDSSETDLWVAKYRNNEIVGPQPLDPIINSDSREAGHGKSKNGAFYFTSNRDDENQCCGDIFLSRQVAGTYSSVQKVDALNSGADEESLFLSPDEDYMIIQAWKNEFGSKHDLYLSYKNKAGQWASPQRLDSVINGKEIEQRPFVSPDKKYLFFCRMSITQENGQDFYESDVYWVSTRSVFKPYPFNATLEIELEFGEPFQIELPKDMFKDVDGTIVSYTASAGNKTALPDWISFDESNLLLSGTWKAKETLIVTITAIDDYKNEGVASVPIRTKGG